MLLRHLITLSERLEIKTSTLLGPHQKLVKLHSFNLASKCTPTCLITHTLRSAWKRDIKTSCARLADRTRD